MKPQGDESDWREPLRVRSRRPDDRDPVRFAGFSGELDRAADPSGTTAGFVIVLGDQGEIVDRISRIDAEDAVDEHAVAGIDLHGTACERGPAPPNRGPGAAIGVTGTVAGVILGVLLCLNVERIRQFFSWISGTVLFNPELYFLSQLPAKMDLGETISVVLMALILSFIATLFPAWRAAKLDPVEALRYE